MQNKTSALLVMDMQTGILSRLPDSGNAMAGKIATAIKTGREKDVLIIFIRVGFQKGLSEISPANRVFRALKEKLGGNKLTEYMELHPKIGVTDDDIVLNKKRYSAFCGSNLEMILRANNITHLILAGISTSGVVLSTCREAFDKDYQVTVLSDGCIDMDDEVHRILIEKIFPKTSEVITIEDWKNRR